jgi:hypothetical protein
VKPLKTKLRAAALAGALSATCMGAAAQSSPKPDGAANGYRLATADGKCATWVTSDDPPPPNETVSWSGGCKNGWVDGFGIERRHHSGKLSHEYIGHAVVGQWHGLGRLHLHDKEGALIVMLEGTFKRDLMQGIFKATYAAKNPQISERIAAFAKEKAGRAIGENYVQVLELFKDNGPVFFCADPTDCTKPATDAGQPPPPPNPADPWDATLPYGGWRVSIELSTTPNEPKKTSAPPTELGICFEKDKVKTGREARHGMLLFPYAEGWTGYLRSGYSCRDDSAALDGLTLTWNSTCTSPSGAEVVRIAQTRRITAGAMAGETEVIASKGDQRTGYALRRSRLQHVGACTSDMVRAGQLSP